MSQRIAIDKILMLCGYMTGRCGTEMIFNVHQLHKKNPDLFEPRRENP